MKVHSLCSSNTWRERWNEVVWRTPQTACYTLKAQSTIIFISFFCIFTLKWSPQVVRCAITRSSKQLLLIYIFLILHFIFSPVAVVAEMVLGISRLFPQERCPNIWIPNGRPFSSVLSAATSLKITRQIRNF